MMTGELKNKIENIWDILWSSGMTNPLTVVEQITYLLFIRMIDEQRDETGIPSDCRWHVFRESDPETLFYHLNERVFPFIRKGIESESRKPYARYLKNAMLLIPSARVLSRVIDAIDALDIRNKDIMGDVYEVLLSKMAQSGKNGQFRTPRHIINMIVDMATPSSNDRICDPAMGTAGFLCAAAAYVRQQEPQTVLDASALAGFDTDQTMLRIGAMNLLLHGIDDPCVWWQDSLSEDNRYQDQFSLILANPPFAGSLDKETVSKDLLTAVDTAKTELLFLLLFMRMLKKGGRCFSIVPNGVLGNTSHAHVAVRKRLVENHRLEAVISMPSGVFMPYSGVSTAVLVFTKTDCGATDNVWFYDMKADGYSLDPARLPVEDNDIPDVVKRFHHLSEEKNRQRTEQSFFVTKQEIVDNGYSFSFGRYCDMHEDAEDGEATEARLQKLTVELAAMFEESHRLEIQIQQNMNELIADK